MHVVGSAPSPRSLRILKHKVKVLLENSFHRCRSCLRHRRVPTPPKDCASFLETQLSQAEFRTVLEQPGAFVKDERMRKELEVDEEPGWDYLLAHDPKEITPVHLYYKKRREEQRSKVKLQQEELELKRRSLSPKHRPSLQEHKPTIRLRPVDFFSAQVKRPPNPKQHYSQNLVLPRISTVPLLQSQPVHRSFLTRSNGKLWQHFSTVFAQAEARHRQQVAKHAAKAVPTISVQAAKSTLEKQQFKRKAGRN